MQKRAFSAARCTSDGDKFAPPNRYANASQNLKPPRTHFVRFTNILTT
ncbi:MAG: hypothetical protein WC765_09665 [Phycisphaerae bacterium]